MDAPSKRATRSTSRAAGISSTLLSIAQGTATTPGGLRPSPQPLDYSLVPKDPDTIPEEENFPPNNEITQPDDPDQPDDPSDHSHHSDASDSDEDEPNLARSLRLLSKRIGDISSGGSASNSIKPRNPDTFDGTDPNKLDTFIFQCSMFIATCAKKFPDDESRVTFTISYLKGTPLEWFQTELNHSMTQGGKCPKWFSSYPEFIVELQRHFGPRDPVNDAVTALESLRYKDSTKATRYNLEFNRHSRRTGWSRSGASSTDA